jgi:hypothetical protein
MLTATPVELVVATLPGLPRDGLERHGVPADLTLGPDGTADPVVAVPPETGLPTDPDGDGLYGDVNGNGRIDFADVVWLFTTL